MVAQRRYSGGVAQSRGKTMSVLTTRWSRPEIQPDLSRVGLFLELRAGCSAQSRYAAKE